MKFECTVTKNKALDEIKGKGKVWIIEVPDGPQEQMEEDAREWLKRQLTAIIAPRIGRRGGYKEEDILAGKMHVDLYVPVEDAGGGGA